MNIYVLECENNKYYVGKTDNFELRMKKHLDGNGSSWTKKYKPLNLLNYYDGTKHSEDEITIKYMEEYGIDNVRGGTFCKVKLPQYQIKTLNGMINSKNDTCFKCGLKGHFITNCPNKKQDEVKSDKLCTRCGRNTHFVDKCYAKKHISGYYLKSKTDIINKEQIGRTYPDKFKAIKSETKEQIIEQDGRTYPDKFETIESEIKDKQDNRTYPDKFETKEQEDFIKEEIDLSSNVEIELKEFEINLVKQLLKENLNSIQKHEIDHLATIDIQVTDSDHIEKINKLNRDISLVNKSIDDQKVIKPQKTSFATSISQFFNNLFK